MQLFMIMVQVLKGMVNSYYLLVGVSARATWRQDVAGRYNNSPVVRITVHFPSSLRIFGQGPCATGCDASANLYSSHLSKHVTEMAGSCRLPTATTILRLCAWASISLCYCALSVIDRV